MTAQIITASELARRRAEREKMRLEQRAWQDSILGSLLDDEDDPPCAPAQEKETQR